MAEEFVMPKLGLTMEAGTIVGWLVDDGVEVASGQPVLTIETDKVESEVEATTAGRFHRVGEVGHEYPCGAQIGWFLEVGEEPPARPVTATASAAVPAAVAPTLGGLVGQGLAGQGSAGQGSAGAEVAAMGEGGRLLASPNAKRLAAERGVDLWSVVGTGPGGRITSEDVPAVPTGAGAGVEVAPVAQAPLGLVGGLATAAARGLAELLGIDVREVPRTGTDPRVTREDVAAHVRSLLAALVPAPASSALLQEPSSVIPMVGMRRTIATRMSDSLHSMAQLTLNMDVDMDAVVADRARRKAEAPDGSAVPGFTDYVIAASAAALVEHPIANSQITEDGVALLPTVNVGMAVAVDGGLMVPVIHDTPSMGMDQLAAETSRLADAARNGKLTLPELEGGTFSVTALGMFDVDGFTPIINAPNVAILGVGRLRDDVAWSADGAPVRTNRMTLSLTWDHRAMDGAPAAQFTKSIAGNLQSLSNL